MPASTKNIAIFCDGTWQQIDQPTPTNVSRLARMVGPFDIQGVPQIVYYDSGVGVASGQDLVADLTRNLGGAFGMGLTQKVMDAYQFLSLNYVPGDRIFIFGFSRGAYTARSLAGLLNLIWILKRADGNQISEVQKFYQDPRRGPGTSDRATYETMLDKWSDYYCHPRTDAFIKYVGVWDTVGELGIPKNMLGADQIDQQYQFHDTTLSALTRRARHAVSIDERRDTYSPTLWTNVADLNKAAADKPYSQRPYQQCWFPGHHSGVGGGQADHGLSNSALQWIAEGARESGLVFDDIGLDAALPDPIADFVVDPASFEDDVINAIGGIHDRMPGPQVLDEVSDAAVTRCLKRLDYKPRTLTTVRADIDASSGRDPRDGGR